ncbi:MAG TPA: 2-phospho-L-lactate guanylyltransferase [Methanosarcinaceae archaeon]|nr:2-phospho-L-lactate guanylyltransferase [Methanosarcinaceae archaeon]
MRAVIPYKKENAKSRLSSVLTLGEREEFVELMLKDVLNTLSKADVNKIDILTTSIYGVADDIETNVIVSELGLNEVLNQYLTKISEPVMIIMADLPLVTKRHIREITASDKDVIIVPGRGGGTNILYIKDPTHFHVKYYGSSFRTHCDIVKDMSQSIYVYDSFLASIDIDEPQDLVELLLHGHGMAKDYIKQKFDIEVSKERVKLSSAL